MTSSTTADPCGARPHFGNARCDRPAGHDGDHSAPIAIGGRVKFAAPYTANRAHPPMNDKPNHPAPDLADALDEFTRYLATAARLAGARIAAALTPDPADEPRRRADADATAALRDDLTHALGSGHLAGLALRAVEPALLAVEVDTAQRMQGDVDRERRRAEAWEADARRYAGNADYWRERAEDAERRADEQQQRAQRAEADAADWRTVATQYEAALQRVRDLAEDMRTWCSPHGVAADYAKRIFEALDQPEETR